MPVDGPSAVREVPVVVVRIVLAQELHPARRVAGLAPEVAVEKPIPVVITRMRMEAIEGVALRVVADQWFVGHDCGGPHVAMFRAPAGRIAIPRAAPGGGARSRRRLKTQRI